MASCAETGRAAQIAALGSDQLQSLTSIQLRALTSAQLVSLDTADLPGLSTQALSGLSSAQIAALYGPEELIGQSGEAVYPSRESYSALGQALARVRLHLEAVDDDVARYVRSRIDQDTARCHCLLCRCARSRRSVNCTATRFSRYRSSGRVRSTRVKTQLSFQPSE